MNVFKKTSSRILLVFICAPILNVKMTVRKWFKFGKALHGSDVRNMLFFIVVLFALDNLPLTCKGEDYSRGERYSILNII